MPGMNSNLSPASPILVNAFRSALPTMILGRPHGFGRSDGSSAGTPAGPLAGSGSAGQAASAGA